MRLRLDKSRRALVRPKNGPQKKGYGCQTHSEECDKKTETDQRLENGRREGGGKRWSAKGYLRPAKYGKVDKSEEKMTLMYCSAFGHFLAGV